MNVFGIQTIEGPQIFRTSLSGESFIFRLWWNERGQSWHIDIFDEDETPLVLGIAMKPGVNMIEQYQYLGLKGSLFVAKKEDIGADEMAGEWLLCYSPELI